MSIKKFDRILSLIKEDRLRDSTTGRRGLLIASESDKGRVINSASFRRLQQKAQVFPLESNAAVRTRLTHSIEVSQVGRHLAQNIIEKADGNSFCYEQLAAFVNTIESACLLHDIGNPPFGHLGESAIKEWFKNFSHIEEIPDLINFDGNPQGFRLMSFLAGADRYGFNLTCSLLLTTTKYPWSSENRPEGKKIGIFSGDLSSYNEACEKIGWIPGKKFPLMRLMDTADEIAYSMSDIEDGLEKGILSIDDLIEVFGNDSFNETGPIRPFVSFKTQTINKAVNKAASSFVESIDAILSGEDISLIPEDSEVGDILEKVKKLAKDRIYTDEAAESVELAGRSVIKGLLNHFGELLKLKEEEFSSIFHNDGKLIKKNNLDFQARLFRRLPRSYREKYTSAPHEDETKRRAHLLVDFISGMTDDFALETYQILEGIRIR